MHCINAAIVWLMVTYLSRLYLFLAGKIKGLNVLTVMEKGTYLLVNFYVSLPVWLPLTPIPHLEVSITQVMYVAVDV